MEITGFLHGMSERRTLLLAHS